MNRSWYRLDASLLNPQSRMRPVRIIIYTLNGLMSPGKDLDQCPFKR